MKPMDALGDLLGKDVLVKIKNGMEISGKLQAFDMHINIVLSDAKYRDGDIDKKFEKMFIRGDTIILIA